MNPFSLHLCDQRFLLYYFTLICNIKSHKEELNIMKIIISLYYLNLKLLD
jgi:hypothetical protein